MITIRVNKYRIWKSLLLLLKDVNNLLMNNFADRSKHSYFFKYNINYF